MPREAACVDNKRKETVGRMQPKNVKSRRTTNWERGLAAAIARLLLGGAACALIGAPWSFVETASAQTVQVHGADVSSPHRFDIPVQPLTRALAQFGRQSGLQVVFPAEVSRGVRSTAVVGTFTPQQALARLLQGTGIDWRVTREGAFVGGGQAAAGDPASEDGSTPLGPITIIGRGDRSAASGSGYQGTPDWVYETPAGVSVISREAIKSNPSRTARSLLDDVAGVLANHTELQNPGISVNIRGLQDQNRVVTMIDGARQNFQRNAHGSTQRTYVDTTFIRQVEVEKGATSAVGGAGALGGTVNFRTLIADDVIEPGQSWGAELSSSIGTNEYNFHGSALVSVRVTDWLSILGGISQKDIGAYDIGQNGTIELNELTYRDEGLLFTGSEARSILLKAEADITDNAWLTLGWFRNDVLSSQGVYRDDRGITFKREDEQDIVNNTLTSSFKWDPESDLVYIDSQIWYTKTKNKERRGARTSDRLGQILPVDYELETFGGSLQNTSHFALGSAHIFLNFGFEGFRDDGETTAPNTIDPSIGVDISYGYAGLNPSGRRDVVSGFTNATLEYGDWLTVSGGLRYDHFDLAGTTRIFGDRTRTVETVEVVRPGGPCFTLIHPVTGLPVQICPPDITVEERVYGPWEQDTASVDVDLADGAFLPTATVAVKPFDWFQPFVKYSRSYRPPTIMEAFATGGHPGASNNEFAPNPWLEPERGRTWEFGANLSRDGVLLTDDRLRMKVVRFDKKIEDYITIGELYRSETDFEYSAYVNLDGITRIKGLEFEANYDARLFYIGGAVTYIDADWADTYTYNGEVHEARPGVLFVPPELHYTIDAGVRLFDERLTVGGRATHARPTTPAFGLLGGTYVTDQFTVYDLYGSFAFENHATLRFAVNNVTDLAYVPALGEWTLPAPGRTFIASFDLRF